MMDKVYEKFLAIGVPIPDVRSAFTVVLGAALAVVFRYIHCYKLRLIMDTILGMFLSYVGSGYWGLISVATFILSYLPLKYIKAGVISNGKRGRKAVVFSKVSVCVVLANFIVLLVLQILKRRKASNTLSPTLLYNWISQQMILFQKLVSLALDSNESFRLWTGSAKTKQQQDAGRNKRSKPHRGNQLPPFGLLLGYCFTTNGSLTGSTVRLEDYKAWLAERNRNALQQQDTILLPSIKCGEGIGSTNKKDNETKSICKKCRLPLKSHNVTVRQKANILYVIAFFKGIFWLAMYAGMGPIARKFLAIGTEEYGLKVREEAGRGILSKLLVCVKVYGFMQLGTTVFRFKYYFVWNAFRAMTLGNYFAVSAPRGPSEGSANYDVAKNIDVMGVEFARSSRDSMASWNINATKWFRQYIYMALLSQTGSVLGKRAVATIITNASSALWHGISSGYYMFFVGFAVCVIVGRLRYLYVTPLFEELAERKTKLSKVLAGAYKLLSIESARIERALFLPFFVLLNGRAGLQFLRNVCYVPLLWVAGHWLVYKLIALVPAVRHISARRRK